MADSESESKITPVQTETLVPPVRSNLMYWVLGGLMMFINKFRHELQGYITPRTFSIDDVGRAIDYDLQVVNSWRYYLNQVADEPVSIQDKTILELGPGADLGIGTLLVSMGAKKYCALDVHNLVESVPHSFYEALFDRVEKEGISQLPIDELRNQLECTYRGENDRINYICDPDFDLGNFRDEGIDLIFSQAAFEHFDDIPKTFAQMTELVRPGARLVAEIDLSTHTRWLRDDDPLNIYRLSSWYYKATSFRGSPNRILPSEYKNILESLGWNSVQVIPRRLLDESYVSHTISSLPAKFRNAHDDLVNHSVILTAVR